MKKQIFKTILSISLFVFSFILVNAEIEDYSFDEIPCQTYTGKNITPGLVIKKGEYVLQEGIDYTLSYKNNKKVGNATISVTGSEEYNDLILEVPFTISYKITYKLNGGTNNLLNPLFYDGKVAIKLKSPTRKGYTFNGWYSDKKFKKKVTTIKKGSKNNLTLYAKWTANKYNVKFNSNGGSGKLANLKNKVYDKSFKLPANKFKRKGYKFIGWNTKKDGTGTLYKNKASVKNLSAKNKATVTLYAQWQPIKYKIKYNLNGGINNESNPSEYYVNTPTISLKNLTKEGYKFLGWYSDKKFKKKITTIKKGSTGNKTLYAKWTSIKYNIIFYGNNNTGGKTNELKSIAYNTLVKLSANGFTKNGYKFVGWNTKTDGTGEYYSNKATVKNLSTKDNDNINLYAQWEIQKYTINYVLNGGINNKNNPIEFYINSESLQLNNPTRDGYTFIGWYTDSKYKNQIKSIKSGSYGNKTIYAKWSKILLFVDKEELNIKNTGIVKTTFWGTGTIRYNIEDTNVVKCSWGNWYDNNKIDLTITAKNPGTTYITISNTSNNETKRIKVVVSNLWDDVIVEIPKTIGDKSVPNNRMTVLNYNFTKNYSDSYKMYINLRLTEYEVSNKTNWATYAYYYDKYGNIIGSGYIYASGIELNNTYIDDISIPNETYKIKFFENPKEGQDLIQETKPIKGHVSTSGKWDNVIVEIPNTVGDKSEPANRVKFTHYNFANGYSDSYKMYLEYSLLEYGCSSKTNWATYAYFYDEDGNIIDDGYIYASGIVLGNNYVEEINVPNNTYRIVINENPKQSSSEDHDDKLWSLDDLNNLKNYINKANDYHQEAGDYVLKKAYPNSITSKSYLKIAQDNMMLAISYLESAKILANSKYDLKNSDDETILQIIDEAINAYNGYDSINLDDFESSYSTLSNIITKANKPYLKALVLIRDVYSLLVNQEN